MDERWAGPESDGEWPSGRYITGHWLSRAAWCHEWSEWHHDDQWSGDCFLCDMGWCLPASDPSSCSAHHLGRKVNGWGEMESCVQRVQSVHQTWSMAGRLVPSVHTRTLLTSPASPQLTPCQHLCRLTIMQWLRVHEAVKQCLFILWLITLKFTAWVWTNRVEQLNGPCSHKQCLFWAQTTKEWLKRVSDNSFKTFEVVMSKKWLLIWAYFCLDLDV